MKQFSELQLKLLHQLSDGKCHSGKILGEQLGVSRTAIWKHISQLTELGLSINRIPQQGYQLTTPITPLDESLIHQYLHERKFTKQVDIHLFATIDSTNRFLKDLSSTSPINLCCAEKQTHGRGRFGRHWFSPFGENIYFSSRWQLNCCLSHLAGLSLVVGLAILDSLREIHVEQDMRIKWPNDVLWGNKKLCGILIEIIAETNSCAQVIIGIGMNVNISTQEQLLPEHPELIQSSATNTNVEQAPPSAKWREKDKKEKSLESSWCSLYEITGKHFERNALLANLIDHLDHYLTKFLKTGFANFATDWQRVDYLQGRFIKVKQSTALISGYALGVNKLGQLCLQDAEGKLHYLSSGDASLKVD